MGTNPVDLDTDGDGFGDLEEVQAGVTNPVARDSDSDGADDLTEITRGLDPLNPDTDGDGFSDGDELDLFGEADDPLTAPDLRRDLEAYWRFDSDLTESVKSADGIQGGEGTISFAQGGLYPLKAALILAESP
ncbi:MAG: hypothetical protein ACI8T1_003537 [Verrucomicrobiales bacterium]